MKQTKIKFTAWYCPNKPLAHFVCYMATQKDINTHLKECRNVHEKYQTMDGLGNVYQMIAEGKCVCFGFRASCPIHGLKTSIYSMSTVTTN